MTALPGFNAADVASPTFALVHRYETAPAVWHLDLYRLESEEELAAIGGEEFFDPIDEITLVEWADRYPSWLPKGAWLGRRQRHRACCDGGVRLEAIEAPEDLVRDLRLRREGEDLVGS